MYSLPSDAKYLLEIKLAFSGWRKGKYSTRKFKLGKWSHYFVYGLSHYYNQVRMPEIPQETKLWIFPVLRMALKIEGKADRTAKVYKFIRPIFWLDKTSLHQGLEKLSENRIHGYSI